MCGALYLREDVSMKRALLYLIALAVPLFLSACVGDSSVLKNHGGREADEGITAVLENAAVGFIETSGTRLDSKIVLLDGNLQEMREVPIPRATLGESFYDPCISGGSLYTLPLGYYNVKDGQEVIEFSLQNLSMTSYDVGRPGILSVAAHDKYIFVAGNRNGDSYIVRYDKITGDVAEQTIAGEYVSLILWANESLMAFSANDSFGVGQTPSCSERVIQFDADLNEIRSFDISALGINQYRASYDEGVLYFTGLDDSTPQGLTQLGSLDLSTGEIAKINLGCDYPFGVIAENGKLYVACYDIVGSDPGDSATLCIFDIASGSVEAYPLPYGADQMIAKDGKLYFLDVRTRMIFIWDIDSKETVLSSLIEPTGEAYSYLTNLFTVPDAGLS